MAATFTALAAVTMLLHAPAAAGAPHRADSIVLRILATNDIHGRLDARVEVWSNRRPVGGAAALAGMMNRLAAECRCATVRLDGGDLMQGTPVSNLTYGRAAVDAANAMGYAAMAIGNHEFDWTIDTLAARIRQARFAWLASNIVFSRSRLRPPWVTPWRMVSAGPLRVAVVGYTSPGTTTSTNPANVTGLGFGGAAMLDSVIGAARLEHPDFVIVVAHEGAFCNRDTGCQGAIVTLAQQLTNPPDLIVSGHTHSLVTTTVAGIPIVQARSNGTALGIVDFVATDSGRVTRMRVETVWADRESPDTALARIVAGYQRGVDAVAGRQVAVLADPLSNDSTLGDMIADALRVTAGADIGLMNTTGVRRSLMAGPVTWGDVFEVLPFGNFVVRLTVTGAVLRRAVAHALSGGEVRGHFSGLRIARAGGSVASVTLADGRAVSDSGQYTLGTEDFLANGGSGYAMLRGVPSVNTGVVDLDAFLRYLAAQPQPVRAPRMAGRPAGGRTP